MIRRSGAWLAAATVFTLVNAVGGAYAAMVSEPMHATAHAFLTLLGLYAMYRLSQLPARRVAASLPSDSARLDELQQSVDAVALEVERIGEARRFEEKLRAARPDPPR